MQQRLGERLTEFMRVYLMTGGSDVVRGQIYSSLKGKMASEPDNSVASAIEHMETLSAHYAKLQTPDLEPSTDLKVRLTTLMRWEAATSHPLLLLCYEQYANGKLAEAEFSEVLEIIESFIVRRAICNVPTNQLKKIFLALTKEVTGSGTAAAIARNLVGGQAGRRWPKDIEFREAWAKYSLYANLERCRVVLEALEKAAGHKEPASLGQATVEHVMPQTLTPEWEQELGIGAAQSVHEQLIDTVGNLTFSAYNSELSNLPFSKKKDHYRKSNYMLNKYFESVATWDKTAILLRAEKLADIAVRIWPRRVD